MTPYVRQAYNQIQTADYGAAEASLSEALRQNSNDFVARRYLAYVLIQKKQPKQALEQMQNLPGQSPFDLFLRGEAAGQLGQPKKAMELLAEAVRESPQNDLFRAQAIEAAITMSEYPRASNLCADGARSSADPSKRRFYEDQLKHTEELTSSIAKGRPCIHGSH